VKSEQLLGNMKKKDIFSGFIYSSRCSFL